jgi:formate-dependent nitrite reductase cytochrome c552 subunit
MQKVSDVKEEFNAIAVGRALIAKHNITTPLDAWKAALAWILHFDKDSQEEQVREHEAQVKRREEEKAKMKAEREEKKARDAVAAKEAIDKGW